MVPELQQRGDYSGASYHVATPFSGAIPGKDLVETKGSRRRQALARGVSALGFYIFVG